MLVQITEIRDDQVVVVRISSWRLARRSIVTCYLSQDAVEVVRPRRVFEMTVHEKIEHAQELKEQASTEFSKKQYSEALTLYAKAVDAVRYVQHTSGSTNEVRYAGERAFEIDIYDFDTHPHLSPPPPPPPGPTFSLL